MSSLLFLITPHTSGIKARDVLKRNMMFLAREVCTTLHLEKL
jgi:hypothetical protein